MKAIMYHYIRPAPKKLPYFRYLWMENFKRQLDWFTEHSRFIERDEFFHCAKTGIPPEGVVLTFDDGTRDHFDHVLPELRRRGLWGIFYVPTGIYRTRQLLDVHRIHLVLGRIGGASALAVLEQRIAPHMLAAGHEEKFRKHTYTRQHNDEPTTEFKRVLNYFIAYEWRAPLLDMIMNEVFEQPAALFDDFYMTGKELKAMHDAGMVIGSHGSTHVVFSKLPLDEQREEIDSSFAALRKITGAPTQTFSYPYGGRLTFTKETEALVAQAGAALSFAVEPRDVSGVDLREQPQALPRWDCNMFPFGAASIGASHPAVETTGS